MRITRAAVLSAALATSLVGASTCLARGAELIRTFRVAPPGVDPNGPSGQPSIGGNGRYVAFASIASNLGPAVGTRRTSNVYLFDFLTGKATLISSGSSGGGGNGASTAASVSGDGRVVAFVSEATNLVAGTPKHLSDVFVRVGTGPVHLLSVAFGGAQPDGISTQPVVSANGRYVAFTSRADDLVPGDDNANSDVFVVDLIAGTLKRVSVSSAGRQANGDSYNPSISADGRLVTFTSSASNLVSGDHNHVPDVFLHDMLTGRTVRVSVSTGGREQNASVNLPFLEVSAISGNGRYVVFDSNASNLVRGAGGHANVFRHDLITGETTLVSKDSSGHQGNNDSFYPATSNDGQVTVFESFADSLSSPWTPNENVLAQDMTMSSMLNLDVTPDGGPRAPELDAQLLQQAAISADGQVVAFVSGANNLVAGDHNGTDDVFVRVISPPTTSFVQPPPLFTVDRRPVVEFKGNNDLATLGVCRLDGHKWPCPVGRPFRLPALGRGPHSLTVFTGDPGTLYDPMGATFNFTEV
jgi:Tol biopolymer transport system component